jgi:peptidyl-prolyl cis-trans isomerase C
MSRIQIFLIISLIFSIPAHAIELFNNDTKTAIATVNGSPIKQSWVDLISANAKEANQTVNQKELINQLINDELVVQEAVKQGFDKTPEYITRQELNNRRYLANLFIADKFKNLLVSDDKIKKEYDNFKTTLGTKEYKGSHILVPTENEAQAIIAQIAKGADFAKLAKEKSKDAKTADGGGSLGWINKNSILGNAFSKLPKGLYSTMPIQSPYGWHVIRLEDERALQPPPLENVKEGLRNRLKQAEISKYISDLRAKATISNANSEVKR